ncbi:MAG: MBL fold metallo-hydrolase [Methylovulum sp.]|uniref:MBL fold metallo-hydrolase n=1 Tax=Methylovulum sp. TaxID=1916980 RepID=UPI00260F9452|nr:MBL fold metallo-hydrolase [Methylovulum sp.]MDD2723312.1 MBL fold metallo-hydrolase [Methylovulum sp.]MDD5126352.1 MBL fold metallo-hydrolase [Methylovulum sp.]
MRKLGFPIAGLAVVLTGCASLQPQALQSAADALDATKLKSIEFSGTGRWFQFGQAPNPDLPWPQFDVSRYTADINYETTSARVQITRKQTVEAGRLRPVPVEQKPDQYVSGGYAWNLAPPANAPQAALVATAQPLAVEERVAEIWATPQGFLKAAVAHHAASQAANGGTEVAFTIGDKYRYIGRINAKNQVERVQTWIDNPILGDTLMETKFSDYQDFGGVQFPAHIERSQGGYPVLDLNVADVKLNPAVALSVPGDVKNFTFPPVKATALADGVFYLTGGTHHSVAIEQQDHVVVVEAPLNEGRSLAVIAKVKEIIPNKPIKYLINTHAHFDHSGGLRTYVDEGATIVTARQNQPYYARAWTAARTINPDRLARSNKTASFEIFTDKHVLSNGGRSIEIHSIAGNGHNDAFALVYLPAEKILIEADAYTPAAANVPAPASPNPYSVNLYENIQKLGLDVDKIAALHGPRVVALSDLRAVIGLARASR